MNIPPLSPTAADVLRTVQAWWEASASAVEYLPVGFGAHHWRVSCDGVPAFFATLDQPSLTRPASVLAHAYAAAAELAVSGISGVLAPLAGNNGAYTVPLASGVLSVTPWIDGHTPTAPESRQIEYESHVVQILDEIHRSRVPDGLPIWLPRIGPEFIDRLEALLAIPWTQGPFGESARALTMRAVGPIGFMAGEYANLVTLAMAAQHRWVPTHGEPYHANQMIVAGHVVLIDWESFALAPAERDMLSLTDKSRFHLGFDPDMLELFALEWRLAEIEEYTQRFHGPHTGDADDQLALAKLRQEISGE